MAQRWHGLKPSYRLIHSGWNGRAVSDMSLCSTASLIYQLLRTGALRLKSW